MHEKWKVKVKSVSRVRLYATPQTAAYQAPLSYEGLNGWEMDLSQITFILDKTFTLATLKMLILKKCKINKIYLSQM